MSDGQTPYAREIRTVLIVEDDPDLRASIEAAAVERGYDPSTAATITDALERLEPTPDLVIVDVKLPDGNGIRVVERCTSLCPMPIIVAISGQASAEEAFRLSQAGARGYLHKPHSAEELWAKVDDVASHPPEITPLVAASVGHTPLKTMRDGVRAAMLQQALGLTQGSRRATARLLKVSRQAIQQVLRHESAGDD